MLDLLSLRSIALMESSVDVLSSLSYPALLGWRPRQVLDTLLLKSTWLRGSPLLQKPTEQFRGGERSGCFTKGTECHLWWQQGGEEVQEAWQRAGEALSPRLKMLGGFSLFAKPESVFKYLYSIN